jgi:hypothetical protein
MNQWYEVTGRGSGLTLEEIHHADTNRPYGKMETFCGVHISVAFRVRPPQPKPFCRMCQRASEDGRQADEKIDRLPYKAPKLIYLGSVRQLTLASKPHHGDMHGGSKHHPRT